jgi:lipopolysaccharide/colanic/teichoic acid biosynthesis glycosyltransferase
MPGWKRTLDLAGSLLALALLAPVFLLVAAIVRVGSTGPVLFRQERVGYARKTFTLLKFRTLKVDSDATDHSQHVRKLIVEDSEGKPMEKLDHTKDVIPLGKILRALCVDELPQLFNVLKGDMSLVGPRPCIPYEADEYLRWHARRFDSVPGMTGLWQVSGKNRTTFKEMIRFDINYEQNRSLWLDLKILLMTPAAIVMQTMDNRHARRAAAPAQHG